MKKTTIENLKGLYQFTSPYHDDKRKLPFEVVGKSYNAEYPVKVDTVEYRGYVETKTTDDYKIETIQEQIELGFLTKVKAPDLNYLFIDQIRNFAHLVTSSIQTKAEFLETIKINYSIENPKTELFYIATEKSIFDSIRLSNDRSHVLFNQ